MITTLDETLVGDLAGQVSGPVLAPRDAGYDDARAVHNGLVDRRPALIVRCRTTGDVIAALAFARRAGLEVSVRGGGHNVAGRAVTDGGVMIDLAEMTEIAVDPASATAVAQGGAIWAELNDATGEHGLAVTGGAISTTGIAGLTLGGGLGWLMGKHGLAADNLLAVELVTADGEVLEVDASSHPDLFWALRGGGGNFGVVTSFTYRLHPVGDGHRRADRPPDRGGARAPALLPRRGRRRLGRADRLRRPGARTGRVRRKARGVGRLSTPASRTRPSASWRRSWPSDRR